MFTVEVYTTARGPWKGAGTNDDVFLSIHGTKGVSERTKLDKRFRNDLEPGRVDSYKVAGEDVGDIVYVSLERAGKDEWHLDKIVVVNKITGHKTTFPHYDWVDTYETIRPGKALLPSQEVNDETRNIREQTLGRRQEMYKFSANNDGAMPGFIANEDHNELPKFVQFHDQKAHDFKDNFDTAKRKFGFSSVLEKLHHWDKPEELGSMAMRFSKGEDLKMQEYYVQNWNDDIVYGNLVLNGPNPVMIQRCSKLPDNFPVTDAMVKNSLQRNLTLEDEMKNGYVYILNYSVLMGIGRYRDGEDVRHTANAMVLLYVRPSRHLVPIAIKLDQGDGPIWTPEDGHGWTLAKLYAKNADVQIHQMGTHLTRTHFVSEAVSVAMLRQLPCVHPVYKLLLPHTRHTIAINTIGRVKLVGAGGVADKTLSIAGRGYQINLVEKLYRQTFQWDNLHVPNYFAKRGVDNAELLPNYYYRDDSLLLWNAIADYVHQMISIYYKSDKDVVADAELQSFMKEVHTEGFPFAKGDLDKQCPDSIDTVDQLKTILTMVIFTCSCQHAAVNFGQFHMMSFPPNYPLALRQPPPDRKWDVQLQDVMAALPDKDLTLAAVAITFALSQYTDDEVYLGEFPEEYFTEEEPKKAQENFKLKLQEISKQIQERNSASEFKYLYLLPERTPSSIAA